MSREIRKVPADWEHPKYDDDTFIGLKSNFTKDLAEWREEKAAWEDGYERDWAKCGKAVWKLRSEDTIGATFEDYNGEEPVADDYMPEWPADVATHFMMYETTSEGTPISPAFENIEKLARWLADTGASAFADRTASYEKWLATCKAGSAVSAVFTPATGLISGVECADTGKWQ